MNEGRAEKCDVGKFKTRAGTVIRIQTVVALCGRYLGKIVVESRHRRKQFFELTEVGRMVALHVIAEAVKPADPDSWQDDGQVYANDLDREAAS